MLSIKREKAERKKKCRKTGRKRGLKGKRSDKPKGEKAFVSCGWRQSRGRKKRKRGAEGRGGGKEEKESKGRSGKQKKKKKKNFCKRTTSKAKNPNRSLDVLAGKNL